jgi:hypothetical protein
LEKEDIVAFGMMEDGPSRFLPHQFVSADSGNSSVEVKHLEASAQGPLHVMPRPDPASPAPIQRLRGGGNSHSHSFELQWVCIPGRELTHVDTVVLIHNQVMRMDEYLLGMPHGPELTVISIFGWRSGHVR